MLNVVSRLICRAKVAKRKIATTKKTTNVHSGLLIDSKLFGASCNWCVREQPERQNNASLNYLLDRLLACSRAANKVAFVVEGQEFRPAVHLL